MVGVWSALMHGSIELLGGRAHDGALSEGALAWAADGSA